MGYDWLGVERRGPNPLSNRSLGKTGEILLVRRGDVAAIIMLVPVVPLWRDPAWKSLSPLDTENYSRKTTVDLDGDWRFYDCGGKRFFSLSSYGTVTDYLTRKQLHRILCRRTWNGLLQIPVAALLIYDTLAGTDGTPLWWLDSGQFDAFSRGTRVSSHHAKWQSAL